MVNEDQPEERPSGGRLRNGWVTAVMTLLVLLFLGRALLPEHVLISLATPGIRPTRGTAIDAR